MRFVKSLKSCYLAVRVFCIGAIIAWLNGCAFLDFNKDARLSGYEQTKQNLAKIATPKSTPKSSTKSNSKSSPKTASQKNANSSAKSSLDSTIANSSASALGAGVIAGFGLDSSQKDSNQNSSAESSTDFAKDSAENPTAQEAESKSAESTSTKSNDEFILAQLYNQQKSWASTPYRSGGTKREGADCSGFVMVVFDESFSIALPRITLEQMARGKKISGKHIATKKLKPADLLFFRTGRGAHGYHVGIYLQNGDFMHLSTKGGVKIVNISNKYWKDRFRKAVRYEIP